MQILKSKPQNADFFNRYAELITSLSNVALIAQIITGACEIGILYTLLFSSFSDFVPSRYLNFISMSGAAICAALIQVGLKKVFPYAIRAILHKHFKGLDLWFSVFIYILTATLLTASIYLSFQGSKEIAEFTVKAPTEKTTAKTDSAKIADFATAQRLYTSDSATIETKYKGKSEAIESEMTNRINTVERTGPATTLRAELKTKLSQLQSDKATELEAKATERKKAIDKATDRADTETATITGDNASAKNEASFKKSRYKGYIGYFTMMCYVFFLSVFTMNEIYFKGSKIETKPIPSQRHFNSSLIKEFIETFKEKFDVFFRTKIQNWSDKTPAQPLPNAIRALYEHEADVLKDTVKVESISKELKPLKIPMKVHKVAASNKNGDDTNDDDRQKPRQIGFIKRDYTKDDMAQKRDDTTIHNDFRNSGISNDETKDETTKKITIVNANADYGKCENCGIDFLRNHKKQKFCGDDCRKESWKNKTGKEFDLHIKNKERNKIKK